MFSILSKLGIIWLALANISNCDNSKLGHKSIPKYNVKYYHANIPKDFANGFVELNDKIEENGSFEILGIDEQSSKNQYLCFVPNPNTAVNVSIESAQRNTRSKAIENEPKSEAEIIQRGVEAIEKSFSRKDCVFAYGSNGGYWTLGYCYGDKVVQFHENLQHFVATGKHKPEYPDYIYVLGRFKGSSKEPTNLDNQSPWACNNLDLSEFTIHESSIISDATAKNEQSRFLQHTLYDGEICDLTRKPRSIDIIYKCDPNHRGRIEILDQQEIKTCVYQMVIGVPKLCSLDEFRPNKVEDQIIDIDCKLIDQTNQVKADKLSYQDFFYFTDDIPSDNKIFPIPHSYKVSLNNYNLSPCGHGFYLGQSKLPINSPSVYFNFRHILVFNDQYHSSIDLLEKLGKMLQVCVGNKILSPHIENKRQSLLSWNDTFILWFELYDFYGSFISLVKVSRDGSKEELELKLQLINPETMLDQDGDLVKVPEFEAPNNAWNFQKFSKGKDSALDSANNDKNNKANAESDKQYQSTSTDIVTVTVTESLEATSSEDSSEEVSNEMVILKKLADKLGMTDINELHQAIEDLDIELEVQHDEL